MSRQSSFLNALREVPTGDKLKAEQTITLIDHTLPPAEERGTAETDAERADSDATTNIPTPATSAPLIKRLTNNSLSVPQSVRQQIARQKYARYGQDRYGGEDATTTTTNSSSALPQDDDSAGPPQTGDPATSRQTSYLSRGRAAATKLRTRKRKGMGAGKEGQDAVIDILYENQRGSFLFGVPRYSSGSLLPSDPKPWLNKDFRTSPSDIRNAQVPDPSWEWVWKGWYVDMSRDVDEEGWEYSVVFKSGFSWHGNHPWFHSFVRRRRWLRMRRRKEVQHLTKEKAHELTAEYFTIHPHTVKPGSEQPSPARTSEVARMRARMEDEVPIDKMDITDIGSLVRALRKASVDREKLVAVRKFVAEGGDELHYLSESMSEIMGLFVYQSSRRQLLADLLAHHDGAHEQLEGLDQHDHADAGDAKNNEHDKAVRHAENIHKAVVAAEEQVKRLEYWSDVKGMANEDDVLLHPERFPKDVTTGDGGHPVSAFASKQHHSEGAPKLHGHAEHQDNDTADGETSAAPSKQSSTWFDAPTSPPARKPSQASKLGKSPGDSSDDGSSLDRYITAPESASESGSTRTQPRGALSPAQRGKQKATKLSNIDGLMEEEEAGEPSEPDKPEEEAENVEQGAEKGDADGPSTAENDEAIDVQRRPEDSAEDGGDVVEKENGSDETPVVAPLVSAVKDGVQAVASACD